MLAHTVSQCLYFLLYACIDCYKKSLALTLVAPTLVALTLVALALITSEQRCFKHKKNHFYGKFTVYLLALLTVSSIQTHARINPVTQQSTSLIAKNPTQLCSLKINTTTASVAGPSPTTQSSATKSLSTPPTSGWQPVTLPDNWDNRLGTFFDVKAIKQPTMTVWYRVGFSSICSQKSTAQAQEAFAVTIDGMNMAGEVYLNGDLLWRDAQMTEPLSRSHNIPRYWVIPHGALKKHNELLVKVVGVATQSSGLGKVSVGTLNDIVTEHQTVVFEKRTLFLINLWVSATLGLMFFCIWLVRPKETVSGWFAMTATFWCAFLLGIVATETAPFSSTLTFANANLICMLFYVVSFFVFTWRFAGLLHSRLEKALWLFTLVGAVLVLVLPVVIAHGLKVILFLLYTGAYFVNCVYFIYIAYKAPKLQHLLMAACLAVFMVIVGHDLLAMISPSDSQTFLIRYTFPFITLLQSLVLGLNLSRHFRTIEHFNDELMGKVTQAEQALQQSLNTKHELELKNTRLQERLALSRELHDGLGGSLVRSIVTLEQANEPTSQRKFLSTLKILRDDLRQIIDTESSADKHIPATPSVWCAPLRHRFTTVFEEMDINSSWRMDAEWQTKPSSMQCLTLARVLEEALTNVIKHSRASQVTVQLTQTHSPQGLSQLVLDVIDNGIGFDIATVKAAGLSVGMRSMQLRMENLQGSLTVHNLSPGTHIQASVPAVGLSSGIYPSINL